MTTAASTDRDAATYGTAALERAARRMPDDARPLRDLGDLLVSAGLGGDASAWESAVDAYNGALTLAPTDPVAWLGKGVALAGAGDLADSARVLVHACELAPRFVPAWENLAAVYDAAGDPKSAAEARAKAASAGK